ncbi:MAG: type II secretion system F family protein [Blastocatellia bacterium]|nr:type II secretion system F family protein [Blastocatellia bacterium]
MTSMMIFGTFLLVSVVTYWLLTQKSTAERKRLEERLTGTLTMSSQTEDVTLQVLRKELMSEIPRLNQLLLQMRLATRLRQMIEQADMNVTVMRLSMFALMLGLLGGMVASLFTQSLLLIPAVVAAAASLPFLFVWRKRQKRLNAFLALLPDSLELMSRGLSAGHAFTEALHMVASEMPEPIAGEFGKTYEEQNLGLSYKLALKNMTTRMPLLDLRLCVTAILIQRETGGNLAEILEKVAHTIRERFRIIEDLKTLTTSSRMSAWVLCGLPLFIAVMVNFMNPEYMDPLWRDPRGQKMVYVAATMQLIGMLLIRKIMHIKI